MSELFILIVFCIILFLSCLAYAKLIMMLFELTKYRDNAVHAKVAVEDLE